MQRDVGHRVGEIHEEGLILVVVYEGNSLVGVAPGERRLIHLGLHGLLVSVEMKRVHVVGV